GDHQFVEDLERPLRNVEVTVGEWVEASRVERPPGHSGSATRTASLVSPYRRSREGRRRGKTGSDCRLANSTTTTAPPRVRPSSAGPWRRRRGRAGPRGSRPLRGRRKRRPYG